MRALSQEEIHNILHSVESWRTLERYLDATVPGGGEVGSNGQLASALGITNVEASTLIQNYLYVQRKQDSETKYVIYRMGRTRGAVWYCGTRSRDLKRRGNQFKDDIKANVARAFAPDLAQISALNPALAHRCEGIIEAVTEGALRVLEVAVAGPIE